MGQFDYRKIKLQGGTETSGADLSKRGISENTTPGVIETQIWIQDNLAENQRGIDLDVARGPVPYDVQREMSRRSGIRLGRLNHRMRFFAAFFIFCLLFNYIFNDNENYKVFLSFAVVSLMFSFTLRYVPELTEDQKKSGILERLCRKDGFISGILFFIIGELFIVGSVASLYPRTALDAPQSPISYASIGQSDAFERQKRRQYHASQLAALYKPGTNVMKIYDSCYSKGCDFPDHLAFLLFSDHAKNPSTYENDVCTLLYKDSSVVERNFKIQPEWMFGTDVFGNRSQILHCSLTSEYMNVAKAEQDAANASWIYFFTILSVVASAIFGFVFIRSARWYY